MITIEDVAVNEAQVMRRFEQKFDGIMQRLYSLKVQKVISESAHGKLYRQLWVDRTRREDEFVNRILEAAKHELEIDNAP